jgi:Na+-transporting methylmalonyl-CoA/oxaloacetate decarboxylase beta subunit
VDLSFTVPQNFYTYKRVIFTNVGIIGGADGAASIFVTASVSWPYIIIAALFIAGCAGFLMKKRKR